MPAIISLGEWERGGKRADYTYLSVRLRQTLRPDGNQAGNGETGHQIPWLKSWEAV